MRRGTLKSERYSRVSVGECNSKLSLLWVGECVGQEAPQKSHIVDSQ